MGREWRVRRSSSKEKPLVHSKTRKEDGEADSK